MIRPARDEDLPELMRLAKEFHSEATPGFPEPVDWVVLDTIRTHNLFDFMFLRVCERGDKLTGFIVGGFNRFVHSYEVCGYLTMFFVQESSRGGKSAISLFREYLSWCEARGVKIISCSPISGIREDQIGRFLEKHGFHKTGGAFIRCSGPG